MHTYISLWLDLVSWNRIIDLLGTVYLTPYVCIYVYTHIQIVVDLELVSWNRIIDVLEHSHPGAVMIKCLGEPDSWQVRPSHTMHALLMIRLFVMIKCLGEPDSWQVTPTTK